MGVYISIECLKSENIDEKYIEKLKQKGVKLVPCMITDNGKRFNGYKKIKNLFEENIDSYVKYKTSYQQKLYGPSSSLNENDVLNELWGQDLCMSSWREDSKNGFKEKGVGEDTTKNLIEE